MAKVTFEYTDGNGQARQVSDISQVPKAYLKSVVASGAEEAGAPQPQGAASAIQLPFGANTALPVSDALKDPRAPMVLGVLAVLVYWKSNNFVVRVLIAAIAGIWLFLHGADLMMHSKYLGPYERPTQSSTP